MYDFWSAIFTPNSPEDKSDVVGTFAAVFDRFGFIVFAMWHPFRCYIAGFKN
jgi:hypothetical protein